MHLVLSYYEDKMVNVYRLIDMKHVEFLCGVIGNAATNLSWYSLLRSTVPTID